MCVDVRDWGGAGARLQLWPCHGLEAQRFQLAPYNSLTGLGGLCVDVGIAGNDLNKFYGVDGYNRLQMWQCNGQINQKFSIFSGIHGIGNYCVDVAAFGRANGTPVQLWSCHGLANQFWEFYW